MNRMIKKYLEVEKELLGFKEKDFGDGLILRVGPDSEYVENPFTEAKVLLEPAAIALYEFILGAERITPMSECITKLYHRAQEIFLELWPNEYMLLID